MAFQARRDDRALRAVRRALRRPPILVAYLRTSSDLTLPLLFAGPTFVLLAYVVAFSVTPSDRAGEEFFSAAAQIIPLLLLVLAIEGRVFRWEMARSSLATRSRSDIVSDDRFQRFAAGEGPVSEAVEAVLVGEVIALQPLLDVDGGSTNAKPVMAAIVAGFAGVAYVAVTGSRFVSRSD